MADPGLLSPGRRRFLRAAGATPLALTLPLGASPDPRTLACARRGAGYLVAGLTAGGAMAFARELPGRGHAVLRRPGSAEAVVLARKPGTFIVRLDASTGERTGPDVSTRTDRHLYGHGAFTGDGRYLLTTENDFERGVGVVGVRDADGDYRQVDEIPSGGVGPHELKLLDDGRSLVVANGGIRTHPDTGAAKLNLDTMLPNVATIDLEAGRLDARHEPDPALRRLSLRHLDVSPSGRVAVATQFHGSRRDRVPAVCLVEAGGLRPLDFEAEAVRGMRQYAGSVAFDASGEHVAATSPHGSRVVVWECAGGRVVDWLAADDVCGIAPASSAGEWLATTGRGHVLALRVDGDTLRPRPIAGPTEVRWDNHLS